MSAAADAHTLTALYYAFGRADAGNAPLPCTGDEPHEFARAYTAIRDASERGLVLSAPSVQDAYTRYAATGLVADGWLPPSTSREACDCGHLAQAAKSKPGRPRHSTVSRRRYIDGCVDCCLCTDCGRHRADAARHDPDTYPPVARAHSRAA